MTLSLFDDPLQPLAKLPIADGAWLLRGQARATAIDVLSAVNLVIAQAPLRHMLTPGGQRMSVAMTNCGEYGWVSDRRGYRYQDTDPLSGLPWPTMPPSLCSLAQEAALLAGYPGFMPDACLINCYDPGARMGLHQDKDERNAQAPIVSLSMGLPVTFLFGGERRQDAVRRYVLEHGDVVVWGGSSRFHFHGVAPLKPGLHALLGNQRINLTFRTAQ